MAVQLTPNRALPYPDFSELDRPPDDIMDLAVALQHDAQLFYGLEGQMPTSSPGQPGQKWRLFYATDTVKLFLDTGQGWTLIGPNAVNDNSLTTAKYQDGSVTNSKIAAGLNGSKLLDDSIDAALKVKPASIGLEEMGSNSVDSARVVNGSLLPADLSSSFDMPSGQLRVDGKRAQGVATEGATLPTQAQSFDGMMFVWTPTIQYASPTGHRWLMQYRSADQTWRYVGGPPAIRTSPSAQSLSNNVSAQVADAILTAPAGTWDVEPSVVTLAGATGAGLSYDANIHLGDSVDGRFGSSYRVAYHGGTVGANISSAMRASRKFRYTIATLRDFRLYVTMVVYAGGASAFTTYEPSMAITPVSIPAVA